MSQAAPLPPNEAERLSQLHKYCVLDTEPEADFDEITRLASQVCDTPISLVSLVDTNRQWFKSRQGVDVAETDRQYAFCAHAILDQDNPLIVTNAAEDERFANNPLVQGLPEIRFYAGVPLVTPDGAAIGTLCVIDTVPRSLNQLQLQTLKVLAQQVIAQLELRMKVRELSRYASHLEALAEERAQQLIHAERLSILGTMCAGIAHEINNPMTFIAGNIQLAERIWDQALPLVEGRISSLDEHKRQLLIEEMPKVLQGAKGGVSRVTKIVKGLKHFSSRGQKRRTLGDINSMVLSALDVAKPGLPKCLKLEVNLDYSVPPVLLDAQELEQVVLNIIFNARDALSRLTEGSVRVSTCFRGAAVEIAIEDNGPGIPAEAREKIWEPFFTTKDPGQGTGLGLAISREIIGKHEGTLTLCEEYTQGTRFVISLPAAVAC